MPDDARPRVAIVFPTNMVARNFFETPVLAQLMRRDDLSIYILTNDASHRDKLAGVAHLNWADVRCPSGSGVVPARRGAAAWAHRLLARGLLRDRAEFGNLAFRFNHLNGFAGHRNKMHLPVARLEREISAGNYLDVRLGRPFPGSRRLYCLLYNLYHAPWQRVDPPIEAFFARFDPDLVVFGQSQHIRVKPYAVVARRRGVPMLGVIGSWDQPTTKGPLPPGVARYVVQSRVMRRELAQYHGVDENKIDVIGWPQMDLYKQPGIFQPRAAFLASIGVSPARRLIVLGANSARLGPHEPGIARHIAAQIDTYGGEPCTLLIRPHPKDDDWAARFGALHAPPAVIVQPAEMGRLGYAANLLRHADIVMASSGTIGLDAAALDTCVINIGFDGDLDVDYYESICRWYEMEHYAAVVATGGTRLVASYAALDAAVKAYLRDPGLDGDGRERLRREQLEPFDGRASERLVEIITTAVGK